MPIRVPTNAPSGLWTPDRGLPDGARAEDWLREQRRRERLRWRHVRDRRVEETHTWQATAPTFVTQTATVFNTSTTPKTASVACNINDLLVAFVVSADAGTVGSTPTNDGTALIWSAKQTDATASHCWVGMWTALVDSTRTIVVSFAATGTSAHFGGNVQVWRSASYASSSKLVSVSTGLPVVNFSVQNANSALVVCIGDWSAIAGAPTWLTNAGAFTSTAELNNDTGNYSVHGGYHADAGTATSKNVGLSAPTGETWSEIVLEVKGPASATDALEWKQPTSQPTDRHTRQIISV